MQYLECIRVGSFPMNVDDVDVVMTRKNVVREMYNVSFCTHTQLINQSDAVDQC